MHSLGSVIILAGMAFMIIAQLIGCILKFRVSILKGFFTFLIPGYFLFALSHNGYYLRVVSIWGLGLLGYVIGTVLLT